MGELSISKLWPDKVEGRVRDGLGPYLCIDTHWLCPMSLSINVVKFKPHFYIIFFYFTSITHFALTTTLQRSMQDTLQFLHGPKRYPTVSVQRLQGRPFNHQTGQSLCLSFFLQLAERLIIFLFEFSLPGTQKNYSIPE